MSVFSDVAAMSLNDLLPLVQQYGLLAVLVGAFLEGETVLLIAGASAHLGLLDLRHVIAVAALGAFLGDTFFFMLGRHFGQRVRERVPWIAAAVPRVDRLLRRWRWGAVIGLRFMYGLRMAGPVLIGAGTMPSWEFLTANALGACLWAALIGGLGYLGGQAVEQLLGKVASGEKLLLVILVLAGVFVLAIRALQRRRVRGGNE
jgi:membrane protein DedA with SNARE-associated domain